MGNNWGTSHRFPPAHFSGGFSGALTFSKLSIRAPDYS